MLCITVSVFFRTGELEAMHPPSSKHGWDLVTSWTFTWGATIIKEVFWKAKFAPLSTYVILSLCLALAIIYGVRPSLLNYARIMQNVMSIMYAQSVSSLIRFYIGDPWPWICFLRAPFGEFAHFSSSLVSNKGEYYASASMFVSSMWFYIHGRRWMSNDDRVA